MIPGDHRPEFTWWTVVALSAYMTALFYLLGIVADWLEQLVEED